MSKNLGILKDEMGNEFYPKSANDVLTLPNEDNANVYTNVYCFHKQISLTAGYLGIRMGHTTFEMNNMFTVKMTLMYYAYTTEISVSAYSYNALGGFHAPIYTTTNTDLFSSVHIATDADGYIWILIGGLPNNLHHYMTCSIDRVLVGFSHCGINYRDAFTTNWTHNFFTDLNDFSMVTACTHKTDSTALDTVKSTMRTHGKVPVGEFILWSGEYSATGDSATWHSLGCYYSTYSALLAQFPLVSGYERSYKLQLILATGNNPGGFYIRFTGWNNANSVNSEYIFDNIWGSHLDSAQKLCNFDPAGAWGTGHNHMYVTTAFADAGVQFTIRRVSVLVYDKLIT